MQENTKPACKRAKTIATAALFFTIGVIVGLKADDCWPEPEPVPAGDCADGKPCPVDTVPQGAPVVGAPVVTPAPAPLPAPADPAPAPVAPSEPVAVSTTGGNLDTTGAPAGP